MSEATRRMTIDDLTDIAVPEQPAISPDGTQIVYVLRSADADADRNVTRLWRVGTTSGEPTRLTHGDADSAPAWSPDGTRIAFLRSVDGAPQVWLLPAGGGEAEQLTTLQLGAGAPRWSPDGTRIAFTAATDIVAEPGDDDAARSARAKAAIAVDRLDYQADGSGLLRTMRAHVHLLDVESRTCRQATQGDWHAGDVAWSPDSSRLAFSSARAADRDLSYRSAVYVLDASDQRARPELVGMADAVADTVTWTSDAEALLVVGARNVADPAGLLRVPLRAHGPDDEVDLAVSLDRTVAPGGPGYPGAVPQLTADGADVLFCARDHGSAKLYRTAVDGGTPRAVVDGPACNVSGLSVAGSTAAVVFGTATSFGEIVTVDLESGEQSVRTAHGARFDDVVLFPRTEREFTISDGSVVQAWLVRDPDASGAQPLLLDVHGGPHNAWSGAADEAHLYHQELAARGWTVLLVNPRASDGYGRQFYGAAVGEWGAADARDLLEPIDTLVAEGLADPQRLAVTGYSYGGFMTCYLTSRDDRFAAAVAGGVVSDLASQNGTSDAAHYLGSVELGATPYEDPDRYTRLSPIAQVEKVTTPTLILQGAADIRCPIGQAQQWFTALRERNVPTRLVLYPDASHLFILNGPPSQRADFNRRIVDWVQRYAGDAAGTRPAALDAAHWQRRLTDLAQRHNVPGAQLGILRLGSEDDLVEAATGVLNVDTGVPVRTDSIFQIGSISKVWTATVAMQLVDEGRIDLDAPVIEVLPELRLADPDVTKQVTLRHLLTHTSGIDGDVFTDTGRGDDCLEKYVGLLDEAGQNHPIGATWSYCNAGFSLIGRIIEAVTGQTWDAAMRAKLFDPLALTHTVTLPEEALLFSAAVGHVSEDGGDPQRAPVWQLPRSLGPAGLITSSVADVLAFAALHLRGGVAHDGTRLLDAATASAMADKHADLPDKLSLGDSWGLGWIRYGWDGQRLIGHDGNTIGQSAFLRVFPEKNIAVALLTNGGNARDLYEQLYREIFDEVAGVHMPYPLTPPAEPVEVDVAPLIGRYERASVEMEVRAGDDGPVLRTTVTGPLAELVPDPTDEFPLVALEPNLFIVRAPEAETWMPVTFYELPNGARYVHFGARATPRVD